MAEKTQVALLTGFLGSGKTTLLSRLLGHPDMGETAVIVNELGEVAIDHHLLRRVDERTVLLKSGCVCCSLRGDLADELRDLLGRRERGEIPAFRRVVVETTGLADPAPILYTLLSEPVVKHHFRLEHVIATVDAVNGLPEPESVRQVAAADTVVVTKTDLNGSAEVRSTLEQLNPTATVFEVSYGEIDPATLFDSPGTDLRSVPTPDGGWAPAKFNTFTGIAFAGLEILPETLQDRSLGLPLHKATREEKPEHLTNGYSPVLIECRRKFARWAADLQELPATKLPPALFNRSGDNWLALFGIAEAAGGVWPRSGRWRACILPG